VKGNKLNAIVEIRHW